MTDFPSLKNMFKSADLLDLALTHKSWLNEHRNQRTSNERLEFLGDAILEFVVSEKIYSQYPTKEEGYLTALRANIVNTHSLSVLAGSLGLGKYIYLSKGEEESGGRKNPSLLADTVEAIIGALFIDGGIESAREFINQNLLNDLEKRASEPLKDFKSQLQEKVQAKGLSAPKYKVVSETGPDHSKKFLVEVSIAGNAVARGEGRSKSTAEQEAARQAIALKVK